MGFPFLQMKLKLRKESNFPNALQWISDKVFEVKERISLI
jgi:hypothetical protein